MHEKLPDTSPEPLKIILKRFCIVVIFSIAFAYIEAALVVYLRTIFYPAGFTFPLTNFGTSSLWKQLLLTEIGREAATMVLLFSSAWLFGRDLQQRFAFFLTIFAVWDIFYYVWLKILINWPGSIMDWDILFLIPTTWASPVLAPVLISLTVLIFSIITLCCYCCSRALKVTLTDWLGFITAALVVVVSFCIAGRHVRQPDFQSHFYWPLFAAGLLSAIALFLKCLLKPEVRNQKSETRS